MTSDRLAGTILAEIPATPGVYLMLGADHELLYVGKATNLRTRLRSYARSARDGRPGKVDELIVAIRELRWEQWPSEREARERETELLRALRPPYNDTHTDRTEYFFITASAADRGRTRLAMTITPGGDHAYGCFPFAAAVPEAFPALVRLLCLAHGHRAPASPTRSAGYPVVVDDEVRPALSGYLSGRSPRLLALVATRLADADELTARSVRRDLETTRRFYANGPRALRRLRLRHRMPARAGSADDLHALVAAQLRIELGVDVWVRPRTEVERRVWAMYGDGYGPAHIAARLNADEVPRFGGGRWSIADVDRVIRGGGDRAARQP